MCNVDKCVFRHFQGPRSKAAVGEIEPAAKPEPKPKAKVKAKAKGKQTAKAKAARAKEKANAAYYAALTEDEFEEECEAEEGE